MHNAFMLDACNLAPSAVILGQQERCQAWAIAEAWHVLSCHVTQTAHTHTTHAVLHQMPLAVARHLYITHAVMQQTSLIYHSQSCMGRLQEARARGDRVDRAAKEQPLNGVCLSRPLGRKSAIALETDVIGCSRSSS